MGTAGIVLTGPEGLKIAPHYNPHHAVESASFQSCSSFSTCLPASLLPIQPKMAQFANTSRGNHGTTLEATNNSASSLSDIDDSVDDGQRQATIQDERGASKRKRRRRAKDGGSSEVNGESSSLKRKRNSLRKAARDPRDEPEGKKKKKARVEGTETRSPSPVIDFDGLSRPSSSLRSSS